jgi:uncharacterized protein YbjQ (UPF0145 family)
MPRVFTTTSYDTNIWEPVKMVTAAHNEAISAVRDIGLSITQLFGGKMGLLDKKLVDLREGVIRELEEQAPEDHMIVGVDFETNILERTMIVVASGTLLRRKRSSGGRRRTTRKMK